MMNNYLIIFFIILSSLCINEVSFSYEEPKESGDVIFRDFAAPVLTYMQDHTGIYYKYDGSGDVSNMSNHQIIHMQPNSLGGWTMSNMENFKSTDDGSPEYRGAYYLPRVDDNSDVTRMAIISCALEQEGADYIWWDGYKDPENDAFRCDGFVEYCYEIALGDDWEPGDNGGIVPDDVLVLGLLPGGNVVLSPNVIRRYMDDYPSTATVPEINQTLNSNSQTPYIEFYFSERMSPQTLSSSTITIVGDETGSHSFEILYGCRVSPVYEIDDETIDKFGASAIRLNPSGSFNNDETVTVTIGTGAKDLAGNSLEESCEHTFQIESAINQETSISVNAVSSDTSIDPYESIVISGTAKYDTGDNVEEGTATINTGSSSYTAAVSNGSFSRTVTGPASSRNVTITVSDGNLSGSDSVYISVSDDGSTSRYDLDTVIAYDIEDEGNGYCSYYYKEVFTTSDAEVNGLFIIDDANLSSDLDFKLRFYYPDGTQYGSDLEEENAFDEDWEWGWWYWGFLIDGQSMASHPGKYKVKFYVNDDRKATHYYVVGWNFVEHRMCKDVDDGDTWMYSDSTNIFSTDDTKAVAWHEFEDVGQEIWVKTNFYAPDGSLYLEGDEHLCEFDLPEDSWYDWYRYYQTMTIKGSDPEYMCGDWTVKLFVKNPVSENWEQYYTDVFRIEEKVVPSIISINNTPSSPIETQDVTISSSVSDNNHLDKVTLHWNDGTDHPNTWDGINSGSFDMSYNIGSFEDDTVISYWLEVWDESGNKTESIHKTFTVQAETVSTPTTPTGNTVLTPASNADFESGGSTTSLGHAVEYQYDWGDGTQSDWGSAARSHYWSSDGIFYLKVHARCVTNTTITSPWSGSLRVIVDGTAPVVEITTNGGADYDTTDTQITITGTCTDADSGSGVNTTTVNTGDANEGTAADWRFTVTLSAGDNIITVTSTDNAGNTGSDTITVQCLSDTDDADQDGYDKTVDCDDSDPTVYPGAPELCDGILNNCDGAMLESEIDVDGDGYVTCQIDAYGWKGSAAVIGGQDCDDGDPDEFPGQIWYYDIDGDGFHDGTVDTSSCTRPDGYYTQTQLVSVEVDNCPDTYNPDQLDSDGDGIGDVCEGESGTVLFLETFEDGEYSDSLNRWNSTTSWTASVKTCDELCSGKYLYTDDKLNYGLYLSSKTGFNYLNKQLEFSADMQVGSAAFADQRYAHLYVAKEIGVTRSSFLYLRIYGSDHGSSPSGATPRPNEVWAGLMYEDDDGNYDWEILSGDSVADGNDWNNGKIVIRSDRIVEFYVNGILYYTSTRKVTDDFDGQAPIMVGGRKSNYDNLKVVLGKNIKEGWHYVGGDMAGSCFYPFGSTVETKNKKQSRFTIPDVQGTILTGDVNGDGLLEIVNVEDNELRIYNSNGGLEHAITLGSDKCYADVLVDVNDDRILDIGIGTGSTSDLKTYYYSGKGDLLFTLSKSAGYDSSMRPEGLLENGNFIISFSAGYSHSDQYRGVGVYNKETLAEEWYYKVGPIFNVSSIADFDSDGELEFANYAFTPHNGCNPTVDNGTNTTDGDIWTIIVDENGLEEFSKKYASPSNGSANHYFVDLDRDGSMEILALENHSTSYPGVSQLHIMDQSGTILHSFDGINKGNWYTAVADIDFDGTSEIVASNGLNGTYTTYILNKTLEVITQKSGIGRLKLLADLNGDRLQEIILLSADGLLMVVDDTLETLSSYNLGADGTVIASDLDQNGITELICRTNGIDVLENVRVSDEDEDGDIDGSDLVRFINDINSGAASNQEIQRFASEFGE